MQEQFTGRPLFSDRLLVNGEAIDNISAFDRGLQYGDGLFETIAVINSRPCLWQRHMQRLLSGCERLGMQTFDLTLLRHQARSLINTQQKGVLKLILTRGNSRRGYAAPTSVLPNQILYLSDWPHEMQAKADACLRLRFCTTPLSINPLTAGIKHLNRLEQILARSEWQDESIFEGVMMDVQGRVVEGTMSNLFIENDGRLLTPDLGRCGVAGVVRGLILDVADEMSNSIAVTEITRDDLLQADACYITNSLLGVRQVSWLERRRFTESSTMNPVMKVAANRVFGS